MQASSPGTGGTHPCTHTHTHLTAPPFAQLHATLTHTHTHTHTHVDVYCPPIQIGTAYMQLITEKESERPPGSSRDMSTSGQRPWASPALYPKPLRPKTPIP